MKPLRNAQDNLTPFKWSFDTRLQTIPQSFSNVIQSFGFDISVALIRLGAVLK
ncbi:MAG: hypothetical protein ABL861_10310 [Nitrosomonas sp.]